MLDNSEDGIGCDLNKIKNGKNNFEFYIILNLFFWNIDFLLVDVFCYFMIGFEFFLF